MKQLETTMRMWNTSKGCQVGTVGNVGKGKNVSMHKVLKTKEELQKHMSKIVDLIWD